MPIAEGFHLISRFDGGKTFITKTEKKLLVCEGSQEECFSSLYWRALCFFPKLHSKNLCCSCVCLIRLILFMAHFFASNWESKKTILLLVLLLNPSFSGRTLCGSSFLFSRIIVHPMYINYTYVVLLTRHRRSVQRALFERMIYATLRN